MPHRSVKLSSGGGSDERDGRVAKVLYRYLTIGHHGKVKQILAICDKCSCLFGARPRSRLMRGKPFEQPNLEARPVASQIASVNMSSMVALFLVHTSAILVF